MHSPRRILPVLCLVCCIAGDASACSGPINYRTVISDGDGYSSTGARILELGGAIRQDRANFHKFNKRDEGDEPDSIFSDPDKRAELEAAVNRAHPEGTDFNPGEGNMMYEEILQMSDLGGHVAVYFNDCDSPPSAKIEILGYYQPKTPHPHFDENATPVEEMDALPPPPP